MDSQPKKDKLINDGTGNNLMAIFPLLINSKTGDEYKMTPSQFIKEMSLTTEERYKKLTYESMQDNSTDYPGIMVTPKILIFQSFEPRKTYFLQIQIRNRRKVSLHLKMICPKSNVFSAKYIGTPTTKIAPGLSIDFGVKFLPAEQRDYDHELKFSTDEYSFSIPIKAIAQRPLLDIPDEITIPPAAVKIATTKIVMVRNIGNVPAGFNFITRGCFKVEPAKGVVGVQELLLLSVSFESPVIGSYSEILYLLLETGEKLEIRLYGSAENVSVRLDKTSIIHDDTFVGLKRNKTFHIWNQSQNLLKFSWKKNKTVMEDLDIIERMKEKYLEIRDLEIIKDTRQKYYKLCSQKTHKLAWERICDDELRFLQKEEFLFQHPCFRIEPQSGEIFPKSNMQMFAIFEPSVSGPISTEAYLEVSGRDERLTLHMAGNGLGPHIVLSIEILDIDFIFLCSVHTYEIIAVNKGDIPGTIKFKQEPLIFGGKVEVKPDTRYLKPGEHSALIIVFTSNRHGDFTEKLNFEIVESGEIVSLILKGKIVSPTLHFDKTEIDFGTIPVGFPISKEVTLSNLSMVPVTFSLRILNDGNLPSLSFEKFSTLNIKPQLPKFPKEFIIEPLDGVVEPYSSRTVMLTLTANLARRWTTNLMVDMWDSETESVSCPIRFHSQIGTISIEPVTIFIPFCFIDFPYNRIIVLENTSKVSVFFYIIPQDISENNSITYTANIRQGVIEPKGTTKVSLTISTNNLGRQTVPLNVLILGNDNPSDMCQICCVGQGPVVTIKPTILAWGEVNLLHETTKELIITNESPISANFVITTAKSESPWSVSPAHGVLAPEENRSLNVTVLLRDRGKYQDVLKILIANGKALTCTISAVGIGSSIRTDPKIVDLHDLGTLFCHKRYYYPLYVKNEGTKFLSIAWCPMDDFRLFTALKFNNPPETVFKVEPPKIEVPAGVSRVVMFEACSPQIGIHKSHMYFYINIETPYKELYKKSVIIADFVEPTVSFDKNELNFYYNISSSGVEEKLKDVVEIKNCTKLPISITAVVSHPFYILENSNEVDKVEWDLPQHGSITAVIGFRAAEDPNHLCKMYRDKFTVSFKEYFKKSTVSLIGEVNYPNVLILPRTINFECIPVGSSSYREFILVNVSPVTVNYCFSWNENGSSIISFESNIDNERVLNEKSENSLKFNIYETERDAENNSFEFETVDNEESNIMEKEMEGSEERLTPPMKPVLNIPEITPTEADMNNVLFPLIEKYYYSNEYLKHSYGNVCSSKSDFEALKPEFTKYFEITPFFGSLNKYESQTITVCFKTNKSIKAKVEVYLDIDFGPTDIIKISAVAAELDFLLNPLEINFGRQLFSETATEYLRITNTSLLEFDFETSTIDPIFVDDSDDSPLESGVLIITPRSGYVPAMSEKVLKVRYHPGLPGKFQEKFQIRIGYLDPITILVTGFAVFPQVFFSLPREDMSSISAELGYAAIASLTPDWISSSKERNSFSHLLQHSEIETKMNNTVHNLSSVQLDQPEQEEDWVIIDKKCFVPSRKDIELAIERILAYNVLTRGDSSTVVPMEFVRSIPDFFVPGYKIGIQDSIYRITVNFFCRITRKKCDLPKPDLQTYYTSASMLSGSLKLSKNGADFGIVTVGRSVNETFSVTNFGPLNAVLHLVVERDHRSRVMHIRSKSRNEIKVGATIQITIHLDPKRSRFSGQYENIEYMFYFEVYQGARIPIKATAIVTYPFVVPSTRMLNFNEVRCGNCKSMYMKLKNFGWVPASWNLSFRLTPREISIMHQAGILDGQPMFCLEISKGVLYPNECCLLKISFKPEFGGKFSASMIIKVDEGIDEHKISLTGEGVESRLKISEALITFDPSPPYAKKLYKYFTIQNPCPFPVEYYFPDFDEQIHEEERILRAATLYYQTKELLLPARNPGDQLPSVLFDFYQNLISSMSTKYLERERNKRHFTLEPPSDISIIQDDRSVTDVSEKRKLLKVKRALSNSRPRSSVAMSSYMEIQESREALILFKDKNNHEIEEAVADYIKGLSSSEARYDPLKLLSEAYSSTFINGRVRPNIGLIIMLHAAPQVNLYKFSKLCSTTLSKRLHSIDQIIIEELALLRTDAAIRLRSIIEDTYVEHISGKMPVHSKSHMTLLEQKPSRELKVEEITSEIQNKLNDLFALREEKSKTTTQDEKSSALSGSKKVLSPNVKWSNYHNGLLEGNEYLLTEILKFRFCIDAENGIIIENLNTKWTNNFSALKMLLKAAGNITDILFICLMNSYNKYKNYLMDEEAEKGRQLLQAKEEAFRILNEESEDEFFKLDLSQDLKEEIYSQFLRGRHEEYALYLKSIEEKNRLKNKKISHKKALISPKISSTPKGLQNSKEREKLEEAAKDKYKTKEKDVQSGTGSVQKSVKKEADQDELQFIAFEEQFMEIKELLECWDRQLGIAVEMPSKSRGKKNFTPRKPSSITDTDSKSKSCIGIPMWLLDAENMKSSVEERVCLYLNNILTSRRNSYETENWINDIPESKTYSVVTCPPHRHPTLISDVFTLTPVDKTMSFSYYTDDDTSTKLLGEDSLGAEESQISMKNKKKNNELWKARGDSRMSIQSRSSRVKSSIVSSISEVDAHLKCRGILQPGESMSWRVQFSPTSVGRYEQCYTVNLVSAPPNNQYTIKCCGICDIPKLDMNPENIFSNIAAEKPQDLIYSPTFFYSNYYFDFGSVIPNQLKDESHNRELHAIFSLTNISSLPAELTVMFADDALRDKPIGSAHFDIEPNNTILKPDETFLLNVYANPSKYGSVEEVLMLFVKGNPKIETIRIKCYGVKVCVNIEPKHVDFDRMLLYRKGKRIITFTNSNLIPLFIALAGYDSLPQQFSFSAVKSWVQPLMTFSIEMEYEASEVQVISEHPIQVLVYDRAETTDPVQTQTFTVSAEAYDVSVEIYFSSKDENHVDYEDIRIQNEYTKTVTLKNIGKYLLGFRIDIVQDIIDSNGKVEFYVSPDEGKLPVGKAVVLTASFQTQTELNWKRLSLFNISLMEPYSNDELVASIPVEVSARSFFSKYIILPVDELNIGPVEVSSEKTVTISIENTGHFSFTYMIEPFTSDEIGDLETDQRRSLRVSEASSKDKGRKPAMGSLKLGAFEISPWHGTVEVKETIFINVTFIPTEEKQYEETMVIRISETPPDTKNGNNMKIIAEGCIPNINFNDLASIFREHHIKADEKDLPYLSDIGYHTIFTMNIKQLTFKNVCLGKTTEAKIHLKNDGQIDCLVRSSNKPEGRRSYSEPDSDNFWLRPSEMIIPSYESGTITIYFRPDLLQDYKGHFTLVLIMPEKYSPVVKSFTLYATTCIPQVNIIEPVVRSPEGQGLVNLPPTTPGRTSSSIISFKNSGKIECKVILEICGVEENIFSLLPKPGSERMVKAWELSKPITHTTVVFMQPGQTAEFMVLFKPMDIKKYFSEIKLFIVDNGFENLSYKLSGESFKEEIILERIQTKPPFSNESSTDSSLCNQTDPGIYYFDLGHCFVNKKRNIIVRIANKTEKDYYKFKWDDIPPCLTIQPSVGHLYPNTYKDLLFVFLPEDSMEIEEVPLICKLNKIHFPGLPPIPSWDERLLHHQYASTTEPDLVAVQTSRIFNKGSSRQETIPVADISPNCLEPENEYIPDSNSELTIFFSAVVDYAHLVCETTELNLDDTFMFQNRYYLLPLENIGNVAIDYTLELKSVTYKRLKIDEASQADGNSLMKMQKSRLSCDNPSESNPNQSIHQNQRKITKSRHCFGANRPRPLKNVTMLDLFSNEQEESNFKVPIEIKDEPYNPIKIENPNGTIMPKETAFCRIIFSPLDVNEYKAVIKIKVDNTPPGSSLPEILINARSVMPFCHFNIPESDYIQSGRRDYSRPGPVGSGPGVPLDPEIKTIETKIIGTGLTKAINFHAINPTEEDYSFTWLNVTQNQSGMIHSLHCSCLDGTIQAGRQKLMEFILISETPGTFEYFWKFLIPEHQIEMTFLFVIVIQEPVIYFLSNYLTMRPTSIGATITDAITMINQDDVSSDFFFFPESLYSEGRVNSIKVQPMSGRISPKSEIEFRISFTGKTSGKCLFHLKCKIKKVHTPFVISIETMTYAVEPLVAFENMAKIKKIADLTTKNIIDFGQELQVERPETIKFFLTSTGKLSFSYQWVYDRKDLAQHFCSLHFSRMEGLVMSYSKEECDLVICFTKKSSLVNFPVKLKITRGPVFNFLLKASSSTPLYEFSFLNYDFGHCIIQDIDFIFYETNLIFRNKDKVDMFLEISSDNLKNFTYKINSSIIEPGKELNIPIQFIPRKCIKYEESISFTIAGLTKKTINLSGHGVEFKVTLTNVYDANIRLGATGIGTKNSKVFTIVNNSLAAATILLGFSDQLPVNLSYLVPHNEKLVNFSNENPNGNELTLSPSNPITLGPKETSSVKIEYTPHKRNPSFTETVFMQFQEKINPLCVITGSATGPEFTLDKKYLSFGAVIANYCSTLKLRIINSGDIGARFKWLTHDLENDFTIVPESGYLSPESNLITEVTFHPKSIKFFIKKIVECKLFISDTQTYPSLYLSLFGDCVDLPKPSYTLEFQCEVRNSDTKTIEITNNTGKDWRLMPVFNGEYFEGLSVVFVASMSSITYDIVYNPMTMTSLENPHKGSIFYCLPDGAGQLYDLIGVSLPPSACDVIEREIPCKTKYTELLKVKNWLQSYQRFKVTRIFNSNERADDLVFQFTGSDTFEVPALAEKEYKLTFFAYKTGKLRFKVTFTNEETQEFIWYDIFFSIIMCEPLELITLKSAVRQLCSHEIKLENPLTVPIQYKIDCFVPDIIIPVIDPVPPETTAKINIQYRPLHPGEKIEQFKISCPELGIFPMELHLTAFEAAPYESIRFEAALGNTDIRMVHVPNYYSGQATLRCYTTMEDFRVEERNTVAGHGTAVIEIIYEPSSLEQISANLYIESEQAGNFTYPLIGVPLKPLAKGPYIIQQGSNVNINFKNVLKDTKKFHIYVDNPAFAFKTYTEDISPGHVSKINVSLQKFKNIEKLYDSKDCSLNPRYPIMGQLVVECFNPHIKWQYYLKGVVEKSSVSKV